MQRLWHSDPAAGCVLRVLGLRLRSGARGLMWLCCRSCAEQRPATVVSCGLGETATVAQPSANEEDAVELTVRPESLAGLTLRRYRELGLSIDPMGHEWYFIVER